MAADQTGDSIEPECTPPRYYAYSLDGRPASEWHGLEAHHAGVESLSAQFAADFHSSEWGKLAGMWHDPGKYLPEFQEKLHGIPHQVDHAIVGALLADSKGRSAALPLAFVIAGHHAGLANLHASGSSTTPLMERLDEKKALLRQVAPLLPASLTGAALPALPRFLLPTDGLSRQDMSRRMEFWIRFLYSALVDADFLDTEAFYEPQRRSAAAGTVQDIPMLRLRLDTYLDKMTQEVKPTTVNKLRAQILDSCRGKAELSPGVFSLSVPTGGGKTLAGMAFALRHAEKHSLRRVIVVIPYTSIIEQNAQKYREVLGEANVIEHHSNVDPQRETEWNKLASENWDAPVVVTTNVQFFESLFANKSSRCRKLHNVARSVIILDEVQSLPSGFLTSILGALRELTSNYGCTVVLSTATQPALVKRSALPEGLDTPQEIAPAPADLFRRLSRVEVAWPSLDAPPVAWTDLAEDVKRHPQVLAVVHRREDAKELAQLLPPDERFHLSALMCPAHRSATLADAKKRLKDKQPCRLVSTQLVEAGVDIDFPVVYRALGGLDSLVQAAGRCNREGGPDKGKFFVFRAPTDPPRGTPTMGLETTQSMLRQYGGVIDIDDPRFAEEYFRVLYSKLERDIRGIQGERAELNFATTAEKFRLIEDGFSEPIVVPYGESAQRVEALRKSINRDTLRALQPYMVSVYPQDLKRLEEVGAVETIAETVRVLLPGFEHLYDGTFGLVIGESPRIDPAALIVGH